MFVRKLRVIPWVAAAALAAVLSLGSCGGGEDSPYGGSGPRKVPFDSFGGYIESAGRSGATRPGAHQVVVIGIDGATWRFLDPLIERGRLPNLARIKEEGAYGTLLSTPSHVSPPAWTSMFSGYSPGKTGVYTFGQWSWETGEFTAVNAADVLVPSVWDVASQAGRKVAVTNVPMTHPVRPVNGVMVSGLMTPVPLLPELGLVATRFSGGLDVAHVAPDVRSYSPPVKTEGSDSLNTFVWWLVDYTNNDRKDYNRVVLKVLPHFDDRTEGELSGGVYVFAVDEYSPWVKLRVRWRGEIRDGWCKFIVLRRPDGQFQALTSQVLLDPRETGTQYTFPADLADELSKKFDYYMPSKFLDEKVVPAVTEEAAKYASFFYDYDDWDMFFYVFTQTDNIQHLRGFSDRGVKVLEKIDGFIGRLMRRLPEESTLIIASDHGFNKFEWGIDINELLEQLGLLVRKPGGDEIDFERTMVFHNLWHLYFNDELMTGENLAAVGITVEGDETPGKAVARFLREREIRSADGKQKFPMEFTPVAGDFVGDDPDLLVEGAYDNYMVEFWNLKRPRGQMVWKLMDSEAHNHEREGVFLVWGNRVKNGFDAGTKRVEDIAPTILYALGLPVASDMDGFAMFDVFHDRALEQLPIYLIPDLSEIPRKFIAADDHRESLEKKLKSLGYVH